MPPPPPGGSDDALITNVVLPSGLVKVLVNMLPLSWVLEEPHISTRVIVYAWENILPFTMPLGCQKEIILTNESCEG